jgi:hypothetical protein
MATKTKGKAVGEFEVAVEPEKAKSKIHASEAIVLKRPRKDAANKVVKDAQDNVQYDDVTWTVAGKERIASEVIEESKRLVSQLFPEIRKGSDQIAVMMSFTNKKLHEAVKANKTVIEPKIVQAG